MSRKSAHYINKDDLLDYGIHHGLIKRSQKNLSRGAIRKLVADKLKEDKIDPRRLELDSSRLLDQEAQDASKSYRVKGLLDGISKIKTGAEDVAASVAAPLDTAVSSIQTRARKKQLQALKALMDTQRVALEQIKSVHHNLAQYDALADLEEHRTKLKNAKNGVVQAAAASAVKAEVAADATKAADAVKEAAKDAVAEVIAAVKPAVAAAAATTAATVAATAPAPAAAAARPGYRGRSRAVNRSSYY